MKSPDASSPLEMKDSDALWDLAMTSLPMRLQQHSLCSLCLQTWCVSSKCLLEGAMPKLSRSYVSSADTCRTLKHPFFGGGLFIFLGIFLSVFVDRHYQSSFKVDINTCWGTKASISLDVYFQNTVCLKIIFWWKIYYNICIYIYKIYDICYQTSMLELAKGVKSCSPLSIKRVMGLVVVLSVVSDCLMRQNSWKRLFADQKLWILLRGQLHQQCCEKWTQVNDETQAKMARMAAAAAWGLGNVSSCAGVWQPWGASTDSFHLVQNYRKQLHQGTTLLTLGNAITVIAYWSLLENLHLHQCGLCRWWVA